MKNKEVLMDISSLPNYSPPLPPNSDVTTQPQRRRISPRQVRVLIDLVWLAGIVSFLIWSYQTAEAFKHKPVPEPVKPLAFDVVMKRIVRVQVGMTSDAVFDLLGPERHSKLWEPEFDDYERIIEAHPDRYPGKHSWAKWADPSDETRWVAVFISGGTVHKSFVKLHGRFGTIGPYENAK
jgi:hypothetical protein